MPTEVIMPQMGESITEGTLTRWLKKIGDTVQRDENASRGEPFDLRIFVAPHEFFWLGEGKEWTKIAAASGSVLYNVEQPQTQWFCRAFPLLLEAPLVLDINLQSAMILRRAGCNVLHFMPGHLPTARYAQPCLDISGVPLAKGYAFARQSYDWQARNRLDERPIDIMFVGTRAPRRDKALLRLQDLMDRYRFLCVYRSGSEPITERSVAAAEQSWVLAQRAKYRRFSTARIVRRKGQRGFCGRRFRGQG